MKINTIKNMILLGLPATGKSGIARCANEEWGFVQLSTSDLLKKEIALGSDIGRKVEQIIEKGELVDDEIVNAIVKMVINNSDEKFLFDGYPRTIMQAEALDKEIQVDAVIYLELSDETAIRRTSNRDVCEKCGKTYQPDTRMPKIMGICDDDGAPLTRRKDSEPSIAKRRIEVASKEIMPLVNFYKNKGTLHTINVEDRDNLGQRFISMIESIEQANLTKLSKLKKERAHE